MFQFGALAEILPRCENMLRQDITLQLNHVGLSMLQCFMGDAVNVIDDEKLFKDTLSKRIFQAHGQFVCSAFGILGQLGNKTHVPFIHDQVCKCAICECSAVHDAAVAAIDLIHERENRNTSIRVQASEPHGSNALATTGTDVDSSLSEDVDSLMQALQNSKQTIPRTGFPLNSDGVVVQRLTRMARSPQLREHLKTTPTLAQCRERVEDAGCSLEPAWGDGAQLFVPLTQEQVAEAELELSFDHVVLLSSDTEQFKAALHEFNCKGKKRPNLVVADLNSLLQDNPLPLASLSKPSASSSSMSKPEEEESVEDGAVDVEPVGFFTLRTDSSLGLHFNID
jgi:hypothetical protein